MLYHSVLDPYIITITIRIRNDIAMRFNIYVLYMYIDIYLLTASGGTVYAVDKERFW